jgi:hypothetical protein
MQLQRVCHDTVPRLISFSLDRNAHVYMVRHSSAADCWWRTTRACYSARLSHLVRGAVSVAAVSLALGHVSAGVTGDGGLPACLAPRPCFHRTFRSRVASLHTIRARFRIACSFHRRMVSRILDGMAWEAWLLAMQRSNQALERTATRHVFTFRMIKTVSVQATLALGGGRSACSR